MQITQEGYDNLEKELNILEKKERPAISKLLKEAISQGDLSENAAYDEAKNRQAILEDRIRELKESLKNAKIKKRGSSGNVELGSIIKIKSSEGEERTFVIVSHHEASPSEGKISYDSPLGSAFVGHKVKDKVNVVTPGGEKFYTILKIS